MDALGYVSETVYDGASRVLSTTRMANPIDVRQLEDLQNMNGGPSTATGVDVVRIALGRLGSIPVMLTSDATIVSLGSSILLQAEVVGVGDLGVVTFFNGNVIIGTASLVNGVATLEMYAFDVGVSNIRASYSAQGQTLASVRPRCQSL